MYGGDDDGSKFRLRLAYIIVIVWIASTIMDAVVSSYDPPALITPLMMGVAGWAFGSHFFSNGGSP